jgi:hypothetical protein
MNVTVKFQGIIADLLKRKSERLELPEDATVADLERLLSSSGANAAAVLKQTRPFIDGRQADRTAPLHDGA